MPFTKYTNLDFDQIKASIKDYLRSNSNFTDFDFEGSNFSVLIDTLAYNTYITAFNSNMIVNESFLDSATIRENVVSLARNIGYVPRSRTAAKATVDLVIPSTTAKDTILLEEGLVCIGQENNTNYIFSIPESITTTVNQGAAKFENLVVYQGTFLKKSFVVDASIRQKFLLDNPNIDTSTIVVKVNEREYSYADNILSIDKNSEIYLIQEVQDEKYEILFGDGLFGKKLNNEDVITVSYIVTDGENGNGGSLFSFAGKLTSGILGTVTPSVTVNTVHNATGGSSIESVESIRNYAPRVYSSQYRAVTARDYETIVRRIYPNAESVSVIGGEEMTPPQFGNVFMSIKPKEGFYLSDFDKSQILSKIKQYSLTGINQKIIDVKVLYVEIDSSVYYDSRKVTNIDDLKTDTISILSDYAKSQVNNFSGRFKYSKVCQIIDSVDDAITSNITKVKIRRNLNALINKSTQYEICFGNRFHTKPGGFNIKSTGFKISGYSDTVYLTDVPNSDQKTGIISIVKDSTTLGQYDIISKSAGTIDYMKGEIILNTLNITSTVLDNSIIEIEAVPESNDVIGLKDLYLSFSIDKSKINMIRDTISSGEQTSGVGYKVTSSYLNGELKRV